jgi:hypothetical protein
VKLNIHLHLKPKLRMSGYLHSLHTVCLGTKGLLWPRCIGLSQWVRTLVFYRYCMPLWRAQGLLSFYVSVTWLTVGKFILCGKVKIPYILESNPH